MKLLSILLASTISVVSFSQITITESDFADGGDTVMVSSSDDTSLDFNLTGSDYTWDFSTINIESQRIDTFFDISGADVLYQLVFNNGFTNAEYESDYFLPWNNVDFSLADQVGLLIEDPIAFTKKSSSKIEVTGFGLKANGISIPAASDTIDVQFELPLNYMDSWTSDSYTELDLNPAFDGIYRRYQSRSAEVDGWGEITTPFNTHEVLRVKTTITSSDSVYVNFGGFGGTWFELPVPASTEYKWFANGQKIPVFTIITQELGGEIITAVEFKDKKREFATIQSENDLEFTVYPNPTNSELYIISDQKSSLIQLIDLSGKVVHSEINPTFGTPINIESLNSGSYLLVFHTENGILKKLISKR